LQFDRVGPKRPQLRFQPLIVFRIDVLRLEIFARANVLMKIDETGNRSGCPTSSRPRAGCSDADIARRERVNLPCRAAACRAAHSARKYAHDCAAQSELAKKSRQSSASACTQF